MFFVVYSNNNKPMQLTNDKNGLQEVKTIKTATVFSEEYKKYFEGITDLHFKPIQLNKVQEIIFKGSYFQYNKVI
jgi:hypothetical protein